MRRAEDKLDAARWEAVEEATELLQEGRAMEALVALRQVLKADPQNAYAFHYLGVGLWELDELEAARDAYRAAVRLAPDYLGARLGYSHVLRLTGDARRALSEAREAVRQAPSDSDARYAAGLAEAALGNRKQARRDLDAFLARGDAELESQLEVRQILELLGMGNEGEPFELDDEQLAQLRAGQLPS
jgi:Flp pilus assembly protein TadD